VELAAADRSLVRGAPTVHAVHGKASFSVRTPGGALAGGGGALGALVSEQVAESGGESMRGRVPIADPAVRVGERLGSVLEHKLGAPRIQVVPEPVLADGAKVLAARFGPGLVLALQTEQWMLFYYPTDWSHDRVSYSASARLLDAADGRVLWQSACEFVGSDPATSPTLEELEANDGALLRVKLDEAADACARQLEARLSP
jgi:hypothetical protein